MSLPIPLPLHDLIRPFFLCAMVMFWAAAAKPVRAADIDLVEQRVRNDILSSVPSHSSVQGFLSSLQSDGTWADLNYSSTSQSNWQPLQHLERLLNMSRAYQGAGSLAGDAGLRGGILRAYDGWIASTPVSSNWYYNEIAVPQQLGQIMVLISEELTSAQLQSGLLLVQQSYRQRSVNSGTNTGANRVDRARATIYRALVSGNGSLLAEAFLSIGDTLVASTAEGIQPDDSFLQHGPQLYVQGYGSELTSNAIRIGAYGAGTSYTFSSRQRRTLVDYFLHGVQWFIRGDTTDYTASGRGLTRRNSTATAIQYVSQLDQLIAFNGGYRTAELQALRDRFSDSAANRTANPSLALSGNRLFPYADIITHHRPGYYVGVKTSSTRTMEPETGNGEGLKSLHLGDGVTLIMRSGNEYDNIMPVWNWAQLPGTTIEQDGHSLKPAADWGVRGNSTFSGGVSDGRYGLLSFDYSKARVAAKKSWFFFDEEFVALGACIDSPGSTADVHTTLNQTLLKGSVRYRTSSGAGTLAAESSLAPPELQWVHHDGVGYVFPGASSSATLRYATQSGNWSAINSTTSGSATEQVFSLSLNHGRAFTGGAYAYLVAPGVEAEEMDSYAADHPITILANTPAVQAVRHDSLGITQATFWTDGGPGIGGIQVDRKASVMVRQDGPLLEVSVADPTQAQAGELRVWIDVPAAGVISADTGVAATASSSGISLIVAVGGAAGKTFQARFYLAPEHYRMRTFFPVADSYVYDGSPDTNYGTDRELVVKSVSSSSQYTRESFLRFDLSGVSETPYAAILGLSPQFTSSPGVHAVASTSSSAWSETGIAWNDKPAAAAAADRWVPAAGVPVSASVTGPVAEALAGSGQLSLAVFALSETDDGYVSYGSRESEDIGQRPVLTLLFPDPDASPPPVLALDRTHLSESGGESAVVTFRRSGDLSEDLIVPFTFAGSAVRGVNYVASRYGSVILPAGLDQARVVISPLADGEVTGNLDLRLRLASGAASPVLTIVDGEVFEQRVADVFEGDDWQSGWTASGAAITRSSDEWLASGQALQVIPSGTFAFLRRTFTPAALAHPGDRLALSFDFRYTTSPANNSGGFRFGLFDSSGRGSFAMLGTGGSTTFSLNRDSGSGFGAGTLTSGFRSTAAASLANVSPHHARLVLTRTAEGTLTVDAEIDGAALQGTELMPPTLAFDSLVIRNGSINARFAVDNVRLEFGRNAGPLLRLEDFADVTAPAGQLYTASLASHAQPGGNLSFSKRSGPDWLEVSPDGALAGTPAESDAGVNTFVLRVTDAAGAFSEASLQLRVFSALEQWRLVHFGAPEESDRSGPAADPDGDGHANLLEYALGTSPLEADSLPVVLDVSEQEGHRYLRLSIRKNPQAFGVLFLVESTADLKSWSEGETVIELDTETELIVRDAVPIDSASRRFLRLKVIQP